MTKQEVEQLKRMRENAKKQDDAISRAALVSIDYLLECAQEDARREQRTRRGW